MLSSPAKAPVSVAASQTSVSQEQTSANLTGAKNSDLETLRRLKDTILNGQHPFFKATPQVAHLQALRVTGQTYSHNGTQAYRAASVPDQDIENVPPHSLYALYGQHEPSFPIERDDDIHATGKSPSQEVVAHDDTPHAPETRDEQMADPSDSVPTGPVLGDSSTADIKPQGGPDRFPERDRYYDGRRSPRADHGAGRDNWEHRQNRPAYSEGRYRDYGGVNRSVSSGARRPYQDRFGGPPPNDRDPYPDSRPYDYNRDKRREPLTHADNRRPGEFHNPKRPYDSGRPSYFPPPPPRPELLADHDRRNELYRRDEPRPAPADVKPLVSAPPIDSVTVTSASAQEKSQGTEPSTTADDVKGDSTGPNPNPEAPPVRSASADVVRPSFRGPSPGRPDTRDSGRFGGPDMRGPPNRNALRGNVAGSRIDRDYRPHDDMRPPYLPLRDYPEPPPRLDSDPRYPLAIPGGPPYERMAPPHIRDESRPPYDPRDRDYRDPYSRSSYPPQPDDRRYPRDPGPPLPPSLMEDSRYSLPPKEFGRPPDIERRRDLDRPERGYDRERGYNNRERDMRPPSLDIRDARGPPPPPLPGALPRSAYVPDRDRDVVSRPPLSARISPRGSDQFAPPPPTPEPRGGYERPGYGGPPPPPGGTFPPRDNPRVRQRSVSPPRRDYRPDDRPPMKRPRPDEPYTSRPPPPPAAGTLILFPSNQVEACLDSPSRISAAAACFVPSTTTP